ncbi:MAG UNVERIFIED_CONTAM: hypothetical protein LVT10_06010 [Anaerolineae bacterium]
MVRGGVAPDHAKIKTVTKVYDKIAQHERFRYFGNVTFGKDVLHADLAQHYHQVLYAVGASVSRGLGIPGETLTRMLWSGGVRRVVQRASGLPRSTV